MTRSFSDVLADKREGVYHYYRGTSSTTRGPALLENTVPPIADDFQLPEEVKKDIPMLEQHSVVLRMCTPKSMVRKLRITTY